MPAKKRRRVPAAGTSSPHAAGAPAPPPAEAAAEEDDARPAAGLRRLWHDDRPAAAPPEKSRKQLLRERRATGAAPAWADPHAAEERRRRHRGGRRSAGSGGEGSDDDDGDEEGEGSEFSDEAALGDVFRRTGRLVDRAQDGRIAPGEVALQRVKDANAAEYADAALSAVGFHPNGTLFLTASPDHCLRLFQVDGASSTKVQSVRFDDLPLRAARFTACGGRIVCAGARPHYSVVDVTTGTAAIVRSLGHTAERNLSVFGLCPGSARHAEGLVCFGSQTGSAHIASLSTKQPLFSVKGDGPCNAVCFDGDELWTLGGSKVYVWDLRTRRPLRVHDDEGSSTGTCLALSRDHYAVGSTHGIVNVYDRPAAWPGDPGAAPPKPRKALEPLLTEARFARFAHDSSYGAQLLAVGSAKKKNAVRLVHLPSLSIFSNFPRPGANLQKPTCCDFSPNSGFFSIGNDRGRALLFRVAAYSEA